ncbi:MAG: four helix bundle protein [Chitinophagaceae bacterium]
MFDFEKLDVYQEAKKLNKDVLTYLFTNTIDSYIQEQWKRATMSMMLHLAEGTGRMPNNEKKHFYTISRSSVFECVAIMDILMGLGQLDQAHYDTFYAGYEKISKMMLGMFRNVT